MKQTLPRVLGLVLATSLWIPLTCWVLQLGPTANRPRLHSSHFSQQHGGGTVQEPPATPSLRRRLGGLFFPQQHANAQVDLKRALTLLNVPAWHRAGFQGQGVKVAILDSGFKGYRRALGKVLPATVKLKSFRKDGDIEGRESQHGILCGEVVHHLAPKAELLFANWEPEQPESFLQAVRWARNEGARIISCSIIMPTWSDGEGHGKIHQALREALSAGDKQGALFFASAGNTALRHWSGPFSLTRSGWHQWAPGKKDNWLHPTAYESVSVELCSSGTERFELFLRDATLDRDVARSRSNSGDEFGSAVVRYIPQPGHHYSIRIRQPDVDETRKPAQKADRFHLTVLGGRLQYTSRQGSIPFPGDGPEVVAVGAVDEHGRRHNYSSCGPNSAAPKPDLVATVPFPSVWRPQQPFNGTSAAAPQAAGLAALLWSRQPAQMADKVRLVLRQTALRTTPGHSVEKGFGLLRLPLLER